MLNIIFSPIPLLLFIIILGFAIGRICIYKISLGIAGILFTAIFWGVITMHVIPDAHKEILINTQNSMEAFSKLGSSLFMSAIGLRAGASLGGNSKGSVRAFIIGALMSVMGVIAMNLILVFDTTIDQSSLIGALCGALTSTPALSSACELNANCSADITWGYGCSYLFGVCATVLAAQILAPKNSLQKEKMSLKISTSNKSHCELAILCIIAFIGTTIGEFKIYLLNVSIGSTAAILIVGLLVGLIMKYILFQIQLSEERLNAFKNLGLALFFAGTGYSTGIQTVSFEPRLIIYGIIITASAIFIGALLCKLFFARQNNNTSFIIAGGMTSSPAYGMLTENETEQLITSFSFAYFGALISLIIAMQAIAR